VDGVMFPKAEKGTLDVTVNDSGGSPLSGVDVRLYDEPGFLRSVNTNGSGQVSFKTQPDKNYKLRTGVSAGGVADTWYDGALTGNQATQVTAGPSATTNVTITTNTPAELGAISGTVVDTNPTPIQGVQARVYNATTGAWVANALTDVNGDYTVAGLVPGNYEVWFWTKYPSAPGPVTAFTSEWFDNLTGEQFDQSGKVATVVVVGAGATATADAELGP
jgi:hypothetical protein